MNTAERMEKLRRPWLVSWQGGNLWEATTPETFNLTWPILRADLQKWIAGRLPGCTLRDCTNGGKMRFFIVSDCHAAAVNSAFLIDLKISNWFVELFEPLT